MSIRSALLGVFSESPFKLIHEHMHVSVSSARLLNDLMSAVLAADWEKAHSIQREISQLESAADRLQRQVNRRLHHELFLPVSRYDVLSMVKSQDAIANQAEDIAGYILGRKIGFPASMHKGLVRFVASAVSVCEEAEKIIGKQDLVMQSGFKGPLIDEIEEMADVIHKLEHENDRQQVELRDLLMTEE
ncbi:MAG: phosphate transport regulator, partial [Legionellales bacterium]|nr:phosphate transport regulator [Legionellales bacterium]HAV93381.1 phosphate transport regulator [Pseudomonadota bacterium]